MKNGRVIKQLYRLKNINYAPEASKTSKIIPNRQESVRQRKNNNTVSRKQFPLNDIGQSRALKKEL